jgi:type VI secretion system protein ImpA
MHPQFDVQTLVQPITVDLPCGESLEDSPLLSSFDTYRLFGQQTSLDAKAPWREIKNEALNALARSKDLRLLAYLGTAVLRTDGIPAFSATLDVAATWLETYWSHVYPLVTEDAVLRWNALKCFTDEWVVMDGLRRAPLVASPKHGRFSLRHVDAAASRTSLEPGQDPPKPEQIDAAFAAAPLGELVDLRSSIVQATVAAARIDARMQNAAGSDGKPVFASLSKLLVRMERVLIAQLAVRPRGAAAQADIAQKPDGGAAAINEGATVVGVIRSRQDAIKALDAVAEFFQRTEPSSPIPLFLERAKRLVSKNFLEVLADVAPEAVAQARAAGGLRQND